MSVTYQDKYQIVSASHIKSKATHLVVNRVDKSEAQGQDNHWFYKSAKNLSDITWLVDCFFEPVAIWELAEEI